MERKPSGTTASQPANSPTKTIVEIVEPTGKPTWHKGEWAKVSDGTLAGWVDASQVEYDYAS